MKKQPYGETEAYIIPNAGCLGCNRCLVCNHSNGGCLGNENIAEAARNAYIANRKNGAEDNEQPPYFDGVYTWLKLQNGNSSVRYTEGLRDRVWMEERDRNYISHLLSEQSQRTLTEEEKKHLEDSKKIVHLKDLLTIDQLQKTINTLLAALANVPNGNEQQHTSIPPGPSR